MQFVQQPRGISMVDNTNPSVDRLKAAGAQPGAANSASSKKKTPVIKFEDGNANPSAKNSGVYDPSMVTTNEKKDWRVRISLPPGAKDKLYNQMPVDGAKMIKDVDGVIFPYTPTMTVQHNARYAEQVLTHSNYKGYFYEGSDVAPINLQGVFTAQNEKEALYVQAAIYFLRMATKMRFGTNDTLAGTPPTLVRLSGYGDFYMPSVTCVVTQFSHTMPDDCDYIQFTVGNKQGRIPAISTIQVTLQPLVSRARQAADFKLEDFSAGAYLSSRTDTTGGLL